MKILESAIPEKSMRGFVRLEPQEEDDIYHLYNLINIDDRVEAFTLRNVVTESKSGARDKQRVLTKIEIQVQKIEFDAEQCSLRINGMNTKENEYLKMGQYHTLQLEINRPCVVMKEKWDSVHIELLQQLKDPSSQSEIAAVVMQEGLAHVCLLKASLTKTVAKIERSIPKKAGGGVRTQQQHQQQSATAYDRFFRELYDTVKRHVNFEIVKVVLVGSPGFLNEEFLQFVQRHAVQMEDMDMIKNRAKFLKTHTSSGHKRAIEEMLASPELVAQLGDVRAAGEVQVLQSFYQALSADPDRACYGYAQVQSANEQLAIETLLVSDTMYRCNDYALRSQYVRLMESVKENGGHVYKFSSLHVSGEQLNMYTGVAAILRFPIPDIAEFEEDDDDDSDDECQAMKKEEKDFDISTFT